MRALATALLAVIATAPSLARATFDGDERIRGARCGTKASAVLASWKTQRPWFPALASAPGESLMRAPTEAIGKWVEVSVRSDRLSLRLINRKQILSVDFDSRCRASAKAGLRRFESRFAYARSRDGYRILRDDDVAKIIANAPAGAFFLWTPHKQISIEGLREFRQAARTFKAPVYAVVEPTSTPSAVQREAKALGLKPSEVFWLDSYDLQMRGFRLHHPSLITFARGRYSSPVRRGFEHQIVYEDYLRSRL